MRCNRVLCPIWKTTLRDNTHLYPKRQHITFYINSQIIAYTTFVLILHTQHIICNVTNNLTIDNDEVRQTSTLTRFSFFRFDFVHFGQYAKQNTYSHTDNREHLPYKIMCCRKSNQVFCASNTTHMNQFTHIALVAFSAHGHSRSELLFIESASEIEIQSGTI